MYAIVDIAGQQFKVEKDQRLFVHRMEGEEGKKVSFDRVLLIDTGSKVTVGDPLVKGAVVSARILSHVKGDKVLVFKKKRRKGYKKLNGHRQYLTQIQIESISEKASQKSAEAKPKTESSTKEATTASGSKKPAAEKKPAAKSTAAKSASAKSAAAKSTAAKSAASKSAAAKKPATARSAAAKKNEAGKEKGEEKES